MDRGRGRGANPWKTGTPKNETKRVHSQPIKESAEQRFQRERDKLQATVKKLEQADSSSEEEGE